MLHIGLWSLLDPFLNLWNVEDSLLEFEQFWVALQRVGGHGLFEERQSVGDVKVGPGVSFPKEKNTSTLFQNFFKL